MPQPLSIPVPAVGPQGQPPGYTAKDPELPLSQDSIQSGETSPTSTDHGGQPTTLWVRLIRALVVSIPHIFTREVMKLLHLAGSISRLNFSVALVVGIAVVLVWSYSKSDPAISAFQDRDKLGIWDTLWAVRAAFGCLVIAWEWRRYSKKRRRAAMRRSTDLEPTGIPPISPANSTDQDLPRGTKASINDTCVVDRVANDIMPFTNIQANDLTRNRASKLDLTNFGAVNPIREALSARSRLPVVLPPPTYDPITSREISVSPAKPDFRGWISKPEGRPSFTGSYSDVWRCRVSFSAPSEALPQEVAVKIFRSVFLGDGNTADARVRLLQRWKQETRAWNGLDHPNIVPLIGWTVEPSPSLISPWYKEGNLKRNLTNRSEFERIRLLLGVSKGLDYLHSRSPPVVHGDLRPENILLSDQGEPLLTDFGLSTNLGEEEMYAPSHPFGGSMPWMSPECMVGESRSCQSDIYSFGSLAFKVLTGVSPHAGLTNNQITLKVCNDKDPKGPVEDWSKYPQLGSRQAINGPSPILRIGGSYCPQ